MINRLFLTGFLFLSSFFVQAAITVTQTRLPAGRGDVDQRILLINITSVSGTLNRFTINLSGTTSISDITSIKIYSSGTSNRFFSSKTLFGSASAATGDIDIAGSQTLSIGSNNYFWLVYDVAAGAAEGNILDATLVSYRRSPSTVTNVNSSPTGSSTILLAHKIIFKSNDVVTDGGVPTASQYFRIPAIITAANGDIITATDARFGTPNDLPFKADIIIRRSTDKGQTWLAPQTIADYGTEGAGDASFILDKTNGNIICLFASHNGLVASTPTDPIRLNVSKSTDNGATWSTPVNITNQVYGAGCTNPITKNWYAVWASAGRHTQLSNGRLVVAVGVSPTSSFSLSNTIIYSDDGGTTWTPVTTLTNPGAGDESHIVQLNNGNLLMSSRINVNGKRKYRISTDLGATWGAQSSWNEIDDSRCNGDLIRYSTTTSGENKNILLHTIPANTSATRQNITVFASQDEGVTWPVSKTIFPGLAQYSSITRLSDGTIGIYYEMADPAAPFEMYFARFSLNWLGISGFITLPVNFLDFSGRLLPSGDIKLNWNVAADNEHSYFEVERSTGQQHFTTIGKVESPYTFLDQHPFAGDNYYRIKAVDKDGKYQYSKIIKIVFDPALDAVSIHPNPATDRLTVELKKAKQGYITLQVSDLLGRIILEKNYNVNNSSTTLPIEIASWKPQLYFLKVIGSDGKLLSVQKFIKQ